MASEQAQKQYNNFAVYVIKSIYEEPATGDVL